MKLLLFFLFALHMTFLGARAVPIASVMGCGQQDRKLSGSKKLFCCEEFNMDCPSKTDTLYVEEGKVLKNRRDAEHFQKLLKLLQDPEHEKKEQGTAGKLLERQPDRHRHTSMRTLGEKCKEPMYHCAVGLECKHGYCFRKKNRAHLESLIERGKEVEAQERDEAGDDDDFEGGDPLPVSQENVVLYGQGIKTGDKVVPGLLKTSDSPYEESLYRSSEIQGASRQYNVASRGSSGVDHAGEKSQGIPKGSNGHAARSGGTRRDLNDTDGDLSGMEEDEITANIADLLEKKIGVHLDSQERHTVRQIIAGTLDERAEREEQVEASEGEDDSEEDTPDNRNTYDTSFPRKYVEPSKRGGVSTERKERFITGNRESEADYGTPRYVQRQKESSQKGKQSHSSPQDPLRPADDFTSQHLRRPNTLHHSYSAHRGYRYRKLPKGSWQCNGGDRRSGQRSFAEEAMRLLEAATRRMWSV